FSEITRRPNTFMPEEWIRRNETEIDLFIPAEIISAEIFLRLLKRSNRLSEFYPVTNKHYLQCIGSC
ncbi:hypothetical protein, partial [Escherichia coli]|uniref:hypothetical protein n=1 Tax=Escherichia coli TaxID=562 RepID=UPI0022643DF0